MHWLPLFTIDRPVANALACPPQDKYVHPEDPTCNRAVLIKTALDQLVWGPLMTLVSAPAARTGRALVSSTCLPAARVSPGPSPQRLPRLAPCPRSRQVFFAFLKALEGHPELIISTIQLKFWPTMLANYALW